jgi:hypothetical protein
LPSLAGALVASALLHGTLLVALSGVVAGPMDASVQPAPTLSARLVAATPPVASVEPVAAPPPSPTARREPPAATPPVPVPKAPTLAPKAVDPPQIASAVVNVDADGPVEAILQNAAPGNAEAAQRVPLEFAHPPSVVVPVETLRGIPQRRIRTLVRVHPGGELELLATDEYDGDLIIAIRDALDRTRAKPSTEGAGANPGWAVVEFWFELPAKPTR